MPDFGREGAPTKCFESINQIDAYEFILRVGSFQVPSLNNLFLDQRIYTLCDKTFEIGPFLGDFNAPEDDYPIIVINPNLVVRCNDCEIKASRPGLNAGWSMVIVPTPEELAEEAGLPDYIPNVAGLVLNGLKFTQEPGVGFDTVIALRETTTQTVSIRNCEIYNVDTTLALFLGHGRFTDGENLKVVIRNLKITVSDILPVFGPSLLTMLSREPLLMDSFPFATTQDSKFSYPAINGYNVGEEGKLSIRLMESEFTNVEYKTASEGEPALYKGFFSAAPSSVPSVAWLAPFGLTSVGKINLAAIGNSFDTVKSNNDDAASFFFNENGRVIVANNENDMDGMDDGDW